METPKLTTRLGALALAMASAACAPRGALAQERPAAAPAAPAAPVEPAAAAPPATQPAQLRRQLDTAKRMQERAEEMRLQSAAVAKANADLAKAKDYQLVHQWHTVRAPSPETPAVIVTQPMDSVTQAEWKEDLSVMDKLVREEVARAGGDDPSALGIKLTLVGRSAPMYVEGAGAIFSSAVAWPLAPAGAGGGKKDDRPRDPASKWEQAKREFGGHSLPKKIGGGGKPFQPPAFDQAKLDHLKDAMVKVLPEATNFRHLKENESVFVTLAGIDDGGAPVRMTLKASKADIDAAASGKLSPEEFAQRVAQRIG